MKRSLILATALVFTGLAGCNLIDSIFPNGQPDPNDNINIIGDTSSAALRAFSSEDDLRDYINSQIVARNEQMGTGDVKFFDRDESATAGEPNAAPQADGASLGGDGGDAAAPTDPGQALTEDSSGNFSETTVQEFGVDEADVVKTDGEFIYIISEQKLSIVRVTPPDQIALVSEVELTGYGQEIYLRDNRIVALTQTYGYGGGPFLDDVFVTDGDKAVSDGVDGVDTAGGGGSSSPGMAVDPITVTDTPGIEPAGGDTPQTEPGDENGVNVNEPVRDLPDGMPVDDIAIDVVEPELPVDEPNIEPLPVEPFPGGLPFELVAYERPRSYVTIIDVTDAANPEILSTTIIDGNQNSSRMLDGVLHLVIANNAYDLAPLLPRFGQADFAVDQVNPMDLLPNYTRIDADGNSSEGALVTWETLYRPEQPDGFGTLSVASIDVDENALPTGVGIVSDPSLVYASTEALYTTDANYDFTGQMRQTTSIYKFEFVNAGVVPVAVGAVPGRVLNQYSMGEYDGYLRVATTVQDFSGREFDFTEPVNNVYVLGENNGNLDIVGRIENIAPGETIQSARFTGERGFLVTFRQTDPFFTLDLADPFNPQLIGELKIPGFSTFLVPMDADHVLAVGQYIPEGGPFFDGGVQVSIFDVSDFANPVRQQNFVVESAYSEALYNPKAFTYFASEGLVAMPINIYDYTFEDFIDVPVDEGQVLDDGIMLDDGMTSGGTGDVGDATSDDGATGGGSTGNTGMDDGETSPDGSAGEAPPIDPADGGMDDAPDAGEARPEPDDAPDGTVDEGGVDIDIISPFPDEYERGGFDGLLVLSVDVNGGIVELGRIDTRFDNRFYASFTRGVFIDETVFAVTNGGVRGVPLIDFAADPFEVMFERPEYPFFLRAR